MYADGLKQVLREKNGQGWGRMGWGGDGDRCDGMGRNLWGWGGYGENKLSLCSSLVQGLNSCSSSSIVCIFALFYACTRHKNQAE